MTPTTGTALNTNFTFKTSTAEDKDIPLTYAFGVKLDSTSVILDRGYNLFNFVARLPNNGM